MKNVEMLRGDPKKAIKKLSIPIMLGGLVNTLYNFVDGIWVAGLGAPQLAAVGLFMPFMIIISALAMGVGVGGNSAISRAIGKRDRKLASNLAEHTLIFGLLIGAISGYSLYPFLKQLFLFMGATEIVSGLATVYGQIILLASPLIFIFSMGNAILRGEGDAKRPMYLVIAGSILNIILDPIFIYTLGFGLKGAAFATVLSITLTASVTLFWLVYKKNTYVQMVFKHFKFKWGLLKDILKVGVPSSITQMSASFSMILLNAIVLAVGGTHGMAAFSAGWRVVLLGIVPIRSVSTAGVSVFGAAFGARNFRKLKEGYKFALKYSLLIGVLTAILIFVFAPQLAYLFTYSKGMEEIAGEIVTLLHVASIYFIALPLAMVTSSLFRGIGWGMHSLAVTLTRSILFQPITAYILAITFGLIGVWVGIGIAAWIAGGFAIIWGTYLLNNQIRREIQVQSH